MGCSSKRQERVITVKSFQKTLDGTKKCADRGSNFVTVVLKNS